MSELITAEQMLLDDLNKSGLKIENLGTYLATEAELAAVGIKPHLYLSSPGVHTPGYVIPYFNLSGDRAPFYRVRLFEPLPKGPRYLQPVNSGSWIYFPKAFAELGKDTIAGKSRTNVNGFAGAIFITEGEKKAATACANGFATCAVGGIYNWRSRTIILPENTQLVKNRDNQIVAKIEPGAHITPTSDRRAFLAAGLEELIKFILSNNLQIIIVFDQDNPENPEVQTAAAELAFEFRAMGVPTNRVRQLYLPLDERSKKMGLDDYLVRYGASSLDTLLHKCLEAKSAFPTHPNLRALINKNLGGQLTRNEAKELSLMCLADMDRHGIRMVEKNTRNPYFFDSRSRTLMPVNLMQHHSDPLHETKFGTFLYKQYDIAQGDTKLVQWLAAGFTGEDPVEIVDPRSVMALVPENSIAYQLSDAQFAVISGDPKNPIKICENGTGNLLFRVDQVEPMDALELVTEFNKQVDKLSNPVFSETFWGKSLSQMKFCGENDAKILAVLHYMSPWLLHWRGTQLPVELLIGEPGSGKSSMYALRLRILTGRPALRNQPTDMRDWYASITASDGLHAIDNVHMVNKELRQRLSDEMCRTVTEPNPHIEMRKLFTTSENFRIPVRTVFAMTAIQQPFLSADILQRAIITEMQAIGNNFASAWDIDTLSKTGGRVAWLAQNLAVMHLFFKKVNQGGWDTQFKSSHRLANFEQIFRLVGSIIGLTDIDAVATSLAGISEARVSEYDWVMEGLKEYNIENVMSYVRDPTRKFTLQDVVAWASAKEDYEDNSVLTNARKLSRYIKSHHFMVSKLAGFRENGKYGNRDTFKLVPLI